MSAWCENGITLSRRPPVTDTRRNFFVAFFNPSFLPQTVLRTGGSIVIAALGIVFHASFRSDRSDLTNVVVKKCIDVPVVLWVMMAVINLLRTERSDHENALVPS